MSPTPFDQLAQVGDLPAEDLLHAADDGPLLTETAREGVELDQLAAVDACLAALHVMLRKVHVSDRARVGSSTVAPPQAKG